MTQQTCIKSVLATLMVAMHFTQIHGYRASLEQNAFSLDGQGAFHKSADVMNASAPYTHAFPNNLLTGFHMEMMGPIDGPMFWSSECNTLTIGEDTYFTGQAAKVTRAEIVPKASAEYAKRWQNSRHWLSNMGLGKLANIEGGAPAQYFAYVRFSETQSGKQQRGMFRYGGFIYFASKAHKDKGIPMEYMNILEKNEVGTMRFKFGYEEFWQLGAGQFGFVNFPPDFSKELTKRFRERTEEFTMNIPRVVTYPWFNKTYTDPAPAVDEISCTFEADKFGLAEDDVTLGRCSFEAHQEFGPMPIMIAPHDKGPLGMPGDAGTRWWPVTAPDILQAGATHYTWVMPGELGNGGFMYHMCKDEEQRKHGRDCKTHFIFFEMLALLCTEHGDTAYDQWMRNFMSGPAYAEMLGPKAKRNGKKKKKNTLLFVIDMQNDFVGMSFQMPCERKRRELASQLGQFIKVKFKEGATIVASLDYHPKGHCGVIGDCQNEAGPFMEYKNMTKDELYYAKGTDKGVPWEKGRYINQFPPHCEWFPGESGRSVPLEGAKFYPPISQVLQELSHEDNSRVHTVFKAFKRTKDSFSALPTYEPLSGAPEDSTGGYAVSGGGWDIGDGPPEVYRPWPPECYALHPPPWCFPKLAQLQNPETPNNFMWRVDAMLSELARRNGADFDEVIVTGLVFDFCVKETAFNAEKLFPGKVIVPLELARPACEGGPLENFIYRPDGLGTPEIIERTEMEYRARGIRLVSVRDIER